MLRIRAGRSVGNARLERLCVRVSGRESTERCLPEGVTQSMGTRERSCELRSEWKTKDFSAGVSRPAEVFQTIFALVAERVVCDV